MPSGGLRTFDDDALKSDLCRIFFGFFTRFTLLDILTYGSGGGTVEQRTSGEDGGECTSLLQCLLREA